MPPPGSTDGLIEAMYEQDPATDKPWTPAAVDTVLAGIEVAP